MPPTATYDRRALAGLLARQYGVIARGQVLACGISPSVLRHRTREGGPWRIVLPGVYLTHTGMATDDQRDMAALLHGGPRSVLTGLAALRRHSGQARRTEMIDVLVPATTTRRDAGFARFHRTSRLPDRVCVAGEISFALPPRAVADAVRGLTDLREVRAIVSSVVQRGICPILRLAEELADGPVQGPARLRQVLAEVADGVRSVAEADLRDLIAWAGLPVPLYNPRLFSGATFIAVPDCWWPDAGVVAEVDSREWHLLPQDWEHTVARHTLMSSHGIVVLHFTPGQIRTKRNDVVIAIRNALTAGRNRPPLPIRTLPAR